MRLRDILWGPTLAGLVALTALSSLTGLRAQRLKAPSFRPSDGAARAARTWAAIDSIGRPGAALRRAFVDTAQAVCTELEPEAVAA